MRDTAYESMRWTDLWGAGVAAMEMCVKQGMLGSGVEMGRGYQHLGLSSLRSMADENVSRSVEKNHIPTRRIASNLGQSVE